MTMINTIKKSTAAIFIATALLANSHADNSSAELDQLGKRWANAVYNIHNKQQKYQSLQTVANDAIELGKKHPNNADVLTWEGIAISTFAGVKGGLGGLSLAKQARSKLERAKTINPHAIQGSIYTSLGTLYAKVPGWPIGFGNKRVAEQHFKKALQINPNGIDPNYFYGEFLANQNQKPLAIQYLQKALQAPNRSGRQLADNGRRQEAKQLLNTLR